MAVSLNSTAADSPEPDGADVASLLDAVYRDFGYDFREYALKSIKRRIAYLVAKHHLSGVHSVYDKLITEPGFEVEFLDAMVVHVSSMFRDPGFFRKLRENIAPVLRSYPFIRIWQAGCATGEEVYSLAILLHEEGLYQKTLIYATDISQTDLQKAKAGLYPDDLMSKYGQNYLAAGGVRSLTDYYLPVKDRHVAFNERLRSRVVFAQHDLARDSSFNEFNVILCRNVLIYFNQSLQRRVHSLLYRSLGFRGVLGLGQRESLRFTPHEHNYEELDREQKLFRKTA